MVPTDKEFSDFLETVAVPVHFVGPDGTILRVNRAELELLGYGREEYIGRNIAEFHVDPIAISDILRRLSAGETLREHPARLRCKDGSMKDVRIDSNVRWENGRFLHTRCFTRDVTHERQLGELRTRNADYLEGLMEGFVAYDQNWVMTYINDAGEKLLGRTRADVVGKTWHEAFPHAVGNDVDAMYQRVMRERKGERMEFFYSHYGRWLEIAAAPVRSGGVGVYFRDISDRVRALDALRQADRRKDEFLAMLAHELRNPLAPIRNGVQLLRLADGVTDLRGQTLDMIDRQAGHLVRLVDDLLDVSRITSGKMALQKNAVELSTVVASAVETCRPAIDAARHTLVLDLPTEPMLVHADFVRLAQVVSNLLNNAARYTASGGRIELRVKREGRDALISIADNGIGIAEEVLTRIFDMFMQGGRDPRGAQGGLGIGLALAKNLVELHGGTIEARSAGVDRGALFLVRLPVLAAQRVASRKPAPRPSVRSRSPRRVLVVDDNVDAARALGLLLEQMGHDVQVAHDGLAALEAARGNRPEIVLLDITMPGIDGMGVVRRLRQDPRFEEVPFVAVTGRGSEEDRRASREAGFDEHLVKPVGLDSLQRVFAAL
jgi:PAS domain S-box-containing protein